MNTILLPDGTAIPKVGQGTWYLGEDPRKKASEVEALQWGVENGLTLIDTAEMYGEGASEELVSEAIRPFQRDQLFLVSKVYPWNAGKSQIFDSCQNSLDRLGTDYLDLYLLHWRGSVPLQETVSCMEQLKAQGKIRRWGVSNFDKDDMEELFQVKDGRNCAVVQDLYHLGSRGTEYAVLPFLRQHGIPLMAYTPLAQAGRVRRSLLTDAAVRSVAEEHSCTPVQVLLAFVLAQDGIFAIPRSSRRSHTQDNRAAADIRLSPEDLALLDSHFPAPTHKVPLDVL